MVESYDTDMTESLCILRYKLIQSLGQGSYGEVWKAEKEFVDDEEEKESFEERIAALKLNLTTKKIGNRYVPLSEEELQK